jgi:hypothetical protein
MTILSVLSLLPATISGVALAHLIWPDKGFKSILLKLVLGIGIGLGANSLLGFLYLLLFNRLAGFLGFQILISIVLVLFVLYRERNNRFRKSVFYPASRVQMLFLVGAGFMLILGALIFTTVSSRKPQGAWDSWMIYNRAARFIHRGGEHWADAFSPELYWFFHADYPPMIPLNVASGWNAVGQETVRVPMAIGGAFLFGTVGLLFAGMYASNTVGQASLAMMALIAVSGYFEAGSKQTADIPLSFFILGAGILIVLYSTRMQRGLLVLAGLSAGLAAWTKNEGIVFTLVSLVGLGIACRKDLKGVFPWYLLGLAIPMTILIYFKIAIAPPGDLFVDLAGQVNQITDSNRHSEILKQLGADLNSLIDWKLLAAYALFLGVDKSKTSVSTRLAVLVIILLQLAGYYGILLISPHHVLWHLSALYRLLLHIGPLMIFLYFSVVRPPETIFQLE